MDDEPTTAERTETVRRAIESSGLEPGTSHRCHYLKDRFARDLAFSASTLPPGVYRSLMDLNFRRSGVIIYRPACEICQQCQALRVPVSAFRPNRTQRRCWKRNRDLTVETCEPVPTEEKHDLYRSYLEDRHDREMGDSWDDFRRFLYESPVQTMETTYRQSGRLIAVGIADVELDAVSTVYCYFDPEFASRSPGVFNVLWTIDHCRRRRISHLYLGYYIRDCKKMNYKTDYQPCEVLDAEGNWRGIGREERDARGET